MGAQLAPELSLVVVADGVRRAVEPTVAAMLDWEKHYDDKPIWQLQTTRATLDMLLRLCWFTLRRDPSADGVPPFDDWVSTVTGIEAVGDDGEGDDDDDDSE